MQDHWCWKKKKKGINSYMVENMFSTGIWFGVDVGWEMA